MRVNGLRRINLNTVTRKLKPQWLLKLEVCREEALREQEWRKKECQISLKKRDLFKKLQVASILEPY